MSETKIAIYFDASSLKDSSCFRKFWRIVVEGWRRKGELKGNHPMAFGSAIHKYLETVYKGGTHKAGLQAAFDYYKPWQATLNMTPYEFRTVGNLLKICDRYPTRFLGGKEFDEIKLDFVPQKDKDGKPLVEYRFQIKIWENDKYVLYLCGTIDLVCEYQGYSNLIVDHKSSASRVEREKFFNDYDWNIQTMLYSKVWREATGLDYYPPVMINGIFVKKPTLKAEKDGIFDGVEFDRSAIITYDDERMERFTTWLNSRIKTIIYYLETPSDNPTENYDMAACWGCSFFNVCKLPTRFHLGALEQGWERVTYNPLHFRD
jgi:hypothetical protein